MLAEHSIIVDMPIGLAVVMLIELQNDGMIKPEVGQVVVRHAPFDRTELIVGSRSAVIWLGVAVSEYLV